MLAIEVFNYNNKYINLNQVYENEDKWVHYDEEETEVGVELADMVFENIISQFTD